MTDDADLFADDPGLAELAERLTTERPLPSPVFRGMLRRRIAAAPSMIPLRRRAAALLATGLALLVVAAAGIADLGPLSPGDRGAGADAAASARAPAAHSPG